MGLFCYEFQLDKIKAHQPALQKLNQIIDWEMFREPIEKALSKKPKSNAGAKSYDRSPDLAKNSTSTTFTFETGEDVLTPPPGDNLFMPAVIMYLLN